MTGGTELAEGPSPLHRGEALALGALSPWLVEHLGFPEPHDLRRYTAGRSNVTYLVSGPAGALVVRCPPEGPLPPGAHDMRREHLVLRTLQPHLGFVPAAYAFCDDAAVIGRVFHVMERRSGVVLRRDWPAALPDDAAARQRIGHALVDALAALHAVDATTQPVAALGRPEGFVQRQIAGWTRRWHAGSPRTLPAFDTLMGRLARCVPHPQRAAVLHNDYKLGNVLLDPAAPGVITALLDWELCALGDPLVDLGGLLAYWGEADEDSTRFGGIPVSSLTGFPTRVALIEAYADATGLDLSPIAWYEAFATVRLAAICEQLYGRFTRGEASDPRLAEYAQQVPALLDHATKLVAGLELATHARGLSPPEAPRQPYRTNGSHVQEAPLMSTITHRMVHTNGIRLHLAEAGPADGPCVIMCHGFPESWYSWRHQLRALGDAGFHAIAPDMRGFGRSSRPLDPAKYTQPKLVGDMVGLLAELPHDTAVIAGHDWGAPVAWNAALMRPDLFPAVIGLSVPYYGARTTFTSDHSIPPSIAMERETGPEGFHYQLYFNEVGRAEADLERDVRRWLAGFFYTASGDAPPEEVTLGDRKRGDRLDEAFAWPTTLPDWLTEDDLDVYAADFERTGFRSALNYYRAADATWEEMAPYRGASITVPACFVAGEADIVILMNEDIYRTMPDEVPDLRTDVLLPGCGHWTQQERPDEVNEHMLAFLADVTAR